MDTTAESTSNEQARMEQARAERSAKRFYTSLVLLLFLIQVCIGGFALYLAIGDPSLAVVPNYHQAALNWDETHQAQLASQRLGWTVKITASDVADDRGMRAVELTVHDSSGTPVDQLEVTGQVYHHASANQVADVQLKSVGEGRYLTMVSMRKPGLWDVALKLGGASEPITTSKTIDVVN